MYIKMIDTIVSDVDGTLLNSQHQITPRTSSALKRALDSGVSLILATGKTFASTSLIREHLKLNTPGVYVQGLVICDGNGVVQEQTLLHTAAIEQVEQIARQHDLAVIAYGGTDLYISTSGRKSNILRAYHEPDPIQVDRLTDHPINKLLLVGEQTMLDRVREEQAAALMPDALFVQAVPQALEVIPPNHSKGTAVAKLFTQLGLSRERMLAIGDGENDIGLLQLAKIGVAMGNASDHVKAHADSVTGDNNHDGVADALEKFVLNP